MILHNEFLCMEVDNSNEHLYGQHMVIQKKKKEKMKRVIQGEEVPQVWYK